MGRAKYAAVIIALLAMTACNSNEPQPPVSSSDEVTYELAGTRWALMSLGDKPVTVSEGSREAYIVLNSADGSVVGHAGCNRISTKYKQTGAQLSFGDVIATRMFCPDMPTETALLEAMKVTAGWRINGSQLELLNAQQRVLARFEARNL
ncbi:META domain-containing protein [Peristeroidobacter soli]|jgi:putative lipoprotein|uniref:META domain-containing protein n=1 Tax=Peristeroidobacter soli TaxID=2497877 RepID=UPI00101BF30A|nr:META domain-containing protein [Peristeroidobacter soli]